MADKVLVLLAATFTALMSSSPAGAQPVTGVEHWIEHSNLKLQVWEKFVDAAGGKPIVVLAHGSGVGGRESFDLHAPLRCLPIPPVYRAGCAGSRTWKNTSSWRIMPSSLRARSSMAS